MTWQALHDSPRLQDSEGAWLRAQIIFFIPYLAIATNGAEPIDDVYAVGKTMFIGIIGVVSLEIALIARYWTWLFLAAWSLSYAVTFPFLIGLGALFERIGRSDYTLVRARSRMPFLALVGVSCLLCAASCCIWPDNVRTHV